MDPENDVGFRLDVLLDASGIKEFKPNRAVKVLAIDNTGETHVAFAEFDALGKGDATLLFEEAPGDLRLVLGPVSASTEQMKKFWPLCVEVPSRKWIGTRRLKLTAIRISAFQWWWWLAPPQVRIDPFRE